MLLDRTKLPPLVSLLSCNSSDPLLLASTASAPGVTESFISLLDDASDGAETLVAWQPPSPPDHAARAASLAKQRLQSEPARSDGPGGHLDDRILHLQGPDCRTTFVRWGSLRKGKWREDGLGVDLPVLHAQVKDLGQTMYVDVAVVDNQGELLVVRASTWQFRAVTGVEVHATCRVRRVWFSEEDMPAEVEGPEDLKRGMPPELALYKAAHTQRNKATSYHLGQLKAKLAKLKRELLTPTSGGGGGGGLGFDVARTGIASIGFIGFPSVGKSSLMSGLTGTESVAAAYEFTTLTTVPGTLTVHGAPIQILDLPGIIEGAKDGKGRGRQVIAVARTCSLICIVLDVLKPLGDKSVIENELEGFGIRLNKQPPNISVKKKDKGGIAISTTVPLTKLSHEEIKAVMGEYRMANADVHIRCDPTLDEFIDVIEGGRVYIPCLYILNKIDAISIEELDLLYRIPDSVPISVKDWLNIDELIDTMWDKLDLVRIYTKPRGVKVPDYTAPVVLKRGHNDVAAFCQTIHKSIADQLKYAVVWGTSAKHNRGQKVGLSHELHDEDVVQLVKRI
ncbi:GTP-binding protein rbg1 [Rhodotorula sphaerocarpa]